MQISTLRYFSLISLFCLYTLFEGMAQCPTNEIEVTIEVKTDDYGYEAYWELLPAGNSCGTGTIFSGGNTFVGCNGGGAKNQNTTGGYGDNSTFTEGPWCLTDGADHDIYTVDDWGDGGTEYTVKIGGYSVYSFKSTSTNETFTFTAAMPPAMDAALHHLHLFPYVDSGAVDINGEVENRGTTAITSMDVNYSVNNGPANTDNISGLNIQPFSKADISHSNAWIPSAAGIYDIKVWVSNINGLGSDNNSTNDTMTQTVTVKPPRVNKIDAYIYGYNFTEIANSSNNLITPRDLDFHPNGELWLVNQETENSGGSTVTIYNPGETDQVTLYRKDGNAWHFMSLPSGIAFSNNGNFATSTSVFDANHGSGVPYTGPSLWSSDSLIYAQPSGGNGSHIDMLHQSPHSMGIASEEDNIFWVFDAYNNDIVRYDFKEDHGPGNDDHSDGEVLRYKGMPVSWISQDVSSHLVLDEEKKWLYIVDGGNKRVIRLDITSGVQTGVPSFGPFDPIAVYLNVINAIWEVVVDTDLEEPVGIDVIDDRMVVSDHSNGDIYIYDISTMPATRLGTIATGSAGVQGLVIGAEGNIWFVNSKENKLRMVEPKFGVSTGPELSAASLEIYPNPASGVVNIKNIPAGAEFTVADITGKVMMRNRATSTSQSLDISTLVDGVYFINMIAEEGSVTKKIVVSQ